MSDLLRAALSQIPRDGLERLRAHLAAAGEVLLTGAVRDPDDRSLW